MSLRLTALTSGPANLLARLLRALPGLLALLLVVLLGWRAGALLWLPFAGQGTGEAPALATVSGAGDSAANRHWFGRVESKPAAAPGPTAAPALGDLKLLGLIAGGPAPTAMLKLGNDKLEVAQGEKFGDGYRLKRVLPEAVLLEHGGREIRLELLLPPPAGSPTAGGALPSQSMPRIAPPAGKIPEPAPTPGKTP